MLDISVNTGSDFIQFLFKGELDISTTEVLLNEMQQIRDAHEIIRFDFSELMFIDSTGVGHLLFECKKWQEKGRLIQFINLNEEIGLIFDLLGVSSILGEECFLSMKSA